MTTKLTEKMFFSCSPAHIGWKLKSEFKKKNKNGGMRNKVRKFVVEMILLL